ncbi:MAG: rod shape-determining protein MreD [Candidatus Staskawiczbacteria bacterium]|nr:rod shape-determining protein MreD [Candidatus Staskawiczbacteria bacterium]
MFKKVLLIIILFYIFALLQSSFFTNFSLFGAIPNLIFIFFFLLVFFIKKENNYQLFILALMAGLLLDILSYSYLGMSIVLLVVIGFLLKKVQSSLRNRGDDKYPFAYFLPLFAIFFVIYNLCFGLYLYFVGLTAVPASFGLEGIFSLIYNLIIASGFFYIYKRWLKFTK